MRKGLPFGGGLRTIIEVRRIARRFRVSVLIDLDELQAL